MKKMKMEDIKISKAFAATTPRTEKIENRKTEYLKTGKQSKCITIDRNGTLVDGYAMYLALYSLGVKEVDVEYQNNQNKSKRFREVPVIHKTKMKKRMNTYVYGVHQSPCSHKEYVWKIPNTRIDLKSSISVGDRVLTANSCGAKVVTVTKIEVSDKPPVNGKIKKVIKKVG